MTVVKPDEADVSRHWTIDDLAHLPDTGKRYEPYPVEICPAEIING